MLSKAFLKIYLFSFLNYELYILFYTIYHKSFNFITCLALLIIFMENALYKFLSYYYSLTGCQTGKVTSKYLHLLRVFYFGRNYKAFTRKRLPYNFPICT